MVAYGVDVLVPLVGDTVDTTSFAVRLNRSSETTAGHIIIAL